MIRAFAVPLAVLALLAAASPASAERLAAITSTGQLALIDTAAPTTFSVRSITGLGVNDVVRGIDWRPARDEAVIVTADNGTTNTDPAKAWVIDPHIGTTSLIGTTTARPGWADVDGDVNFNPVADRIRAVNVNNENFRINPDSGVLSGNDTDLTYAAGPGLIGVAYDRN